MGLVYTEITLKNAGDVADAGRGLIKTQEIRQTTVQALVDSGASTLVINDEVCKALGLKIEGSRLGVLADGTTQKNAVTEPVNIHWKNRDTVCKATVLPNGKVLLGAIPLQDMDLIIHPSKHELCGAHGDEVQVYL